MPAFVLPGEVRHRQAIGRQTGGRAQTVSGSFSICDLRGAILAQSGGQGRFFIEQYDNLVLKHFYQDYQDYHVTRYDLRFLHDQHCDHVTLQTHEP